MLASSARSHAADAAGAGSARMADRPLCSSLLLSSPCSQYPDLVLVDYTLPSVLNGNAEFYCEWCTAGTAEFLGCHQMGSRVLPWAAAGAEEDLPGSVASACSCASAVGCNAVVAALVCRAAGANKLPFVMGTTGGDRDKLLADVSAGSGTPHHC